MVEDSRNSLRIPGNFIAQAAVWTGEVVTGRPWPQPLRAADLPRMGHTLGPLTKDELLEGRSKDELYEDRPKDEGQLWLGSPKYDPFVHNKPPGGPDNHIRHLLVENGEWKIINKSSSFVDELRRFVDVFPFSILY
jgi:hypothetical protein